MCLHVRWKPVDLLQRERAKQSHRRDPPEVHPDQADYPRLADMRDVIIIVPGNRSRRLATESEQEQRRQRDAGSSKRAPPATRNQVLPSRASVRAAPEGHAHPGPAVQVSCLGGHAAQLSMDEHQACEPRRSGDTSPMKRRSCSWRSHRCGNVGSAPFGTRVRRCHLIGPIVEGSFPSPGVFGGAASAAATRRRVGPRRARCSSEAGSRCGRSRWRDATLLERAAGA